ncbi:MAG: M14 family metallopeptidase [Candidatus Zhuqueibacterota bacterium]
MKLAKTVLFFILLLSPLATGQTLLTRAEASHFTATSNYAEVLDFLNQLQQKSQLMKLISIGQSTEGREIILAILGDPAPASPAQLLAMDKPAIYIQANIHAGEVEGKEAMLMLMRDILTGELRQLLKNQVLLIVPNFNPDGNEQIDQKNRRNQLGPEGGVGVRHNGQNLDLNRDFIKVESPENAAAFAEILNRWDPMLLIDLHTTNGSYHQHPVTFATSHNPNCNQSLPHYVREKLLANVVAEMESRYDYSAVYYGNFEDHRDPNRGWTTVDHEVFYSTNYWGLRNRFAILDENYSYADYETRVRACYRFIQLILEYTQKHGAEMRRMIQQVDSETISRGLSPDTTAQFGLEFQTVQCEKPILIKSYEFEKYNDENGRERVKKTDRMKDYTIPFFGKFIKTKQIALPKGYFFSGNLHEVAAKLMQHGIAVERLNQPLHASVESFQISEIKPDERLYQGHRRTRLKGVYQMVEKDFPAGTFYVGMDQPLADLVAYLLEPESDGGLVQWNFFDRYLMVSQWGNQLHPFPVFRLKGPMNFSRQLWTSDGTGE